MRNLKIELTNPAEPSLEDLVSKRIIPFMDSCKKEFAYKCGTLNAHMLGSRPFIDSLKRRLSEDPDFSAIFICSPVIICRGSKSNKTHRLLDLVEGNKYIGLNLWVTRYRPKMHYMLRDQSDIKINMKSKPAYCIIEGNHGEADIKSRFVANLAGKPLVPFLDYQTSFDARYIKRCTSRKQVYLMTIEEYKKWKNAAKFERRYGPHLSRQVLGIKSEKEDWITDIQKAIYPMIRSSLSPKYRRIYNL